METKKDQKHSFNHFSCQFKCHSIYVSLQEKEFRSVYNIF